MSARSALEQLVSLIGALLLTFLLSACGEMPSQTPVSRTVTPTIGVAPPTAIVPTVTQATTLIPSETPATVPDLPNTPIFHGYLFAPYHDPECQLPCWWGLRVGVSSRDDVQAAFRDLTGLGESHDFFEEFDASDPMGIGIIDDIPEDSAAGYEWSNRDGDEYGLLLIAVMNPDLDTLAGINLGLGANNFTPQLVLQELGAPTTILVRMPSTLDGADVSTTYLYEDKGIAIFFGLFSDLPIEQDSDGRYVTYCLNVPHGYSDSVIVEPFPDLQPEDRSLLQRNWVFYRTDGRNIADISDVAVETMAERALSEENVCIEIDYIGL